MVTSSCVGPTPPEVNTTSYAALAARTSAEISSTSTGITTMRRTSTPRARSSRQRYAALASVILPERISLPIKMMPAVFAIRGPHGSTEFGRRSARGRARRRGGPTPAICRGPSARMAAARSWIHSRKDRDERARLDILGVHLDRKAPLPNVERLAGEITAPRREARFFNVNAADEEKRADVAAEMERTLRERNQ